MEPFIKFLIDDKALGNREAPVCCGMLSAWTRVVDHLGAQHLPTLISAFEGHLSKASPASETKDQIKEAVVIQNSVWSPGSSPQLSGQVTPGYCE